VAKTPRESTENQVESETPAGWKPKVSVLADFFTDFIGLPKDIQRKVADFFRKFAEDPRSPGIKYEPLEQAGDDRVRSVRFDDAYRGILYAPEEGNIHLLLRVDIEERLYKWVKHVKFKTLKRSDEVVVSLVEKEESSPDPPPVPKEGLLANYSDKDLKSVGVPAVLMPLLKAITDEKNLELLLAHLSEKSLSKESREAVNLLAQKGGTVEEVRDLYLEATSTQIDLELAMQLVTLISEDKETGSPWKEKFRRSVLKAKNDTSPGTGISKIVRYYLEDTGS
jgi:hypothetical protein